MGKFYKYSRVYAIISTSFLPGTERSLSLWVSSWMCLFPPFCLFCFMNFEALWLRAFKMVTTSCLVIIMKYPSIALVTSFFFSCSNLMFSKLKCSWHTMNVTLVSGVTHPLSWGQLGLTLIQQHQLSQVSSFEACLPYFQPMSISLYLKSIFGSLFNPFWQSLPSNWSTFCM